MAEVVELDDCCAETDSDNDSWRRTRAGISNSAGGNVDDMLKRLGAVELGITDLRTQVGVIAAVIPNLATKSDLAELNSQVRAIDAVIPHLATKSDLGALETRLIKWMVATWITSVGLAFSIAKFVH